MKKLLVIGIIGLFLVVSLVPGIAANIFPILNDNTINVQPGIEIKKPQPGVYIFGNKILETENIIIIIGAFTVEAGGYHGDYYIDRIEFYFNDLLIGVDNSPPFSIFFTIRHFGKGTIKAIGYDWENYISEHTLDVYYFKFL